MIKSVWKPIYFKGKIVNYELVDNSEIKDIKGKTAYKAIWICDNKECKNIKKIHAISAFHLKKPKMCYDLQICRPCQCTGSGNGRYGDNRKWDELHSTEKVQSLKKLMSEKWLGELNPSKKEEVKVKKNQTIINETYIRKIIKQKNFKLIEIIKLDGKNSKFIVECEKGHISDKTYVNFTKKEKKFICQKCFYDNISLNLTEDEIKNIENYKRQIRALTAKNYKIYKNLINPKNLKLGKSDYHIDHKFSIYEGYKNNLDPIVIASKENLEVIHSKENLSKQQKCSITLNELKELTKYLYKK